MMRRARTRTLAFGSAKPEEDKRLELNLEGTAMTKSWDAGPASRVCWDGSCHFKQYNHNGATTTTTG